MNKRVKASSFFSFSSFRYQFPILRLLTAGATLAACLCAASSFAQQQNLPQKQESANSIPSLITHPVNNAERVILKGNVHPLARPQYDRGLAPDGLPLDRILFVLKRSKQQQAALDKLLTEQQEKSSPDYHHWLTPQQFGKEFGPSVSDIHAVTDWLTSEGFQVNHVTNGRTMIEFSGSAGLLRQVFRTEIHKYVIKGKSYWANASNPQIPAALAPVVKGIASLNNFPRRPLYRPVGVFSRSKATGKIKPLFTFNCPQGYTCNGTTFYALGPTDFATIYNVLPLWSAGIDGTGETIAIVSDSNINPQDVANFRSLFGLPPKPVNVILDGPDPGIVPGSETEADVDTEWAGAVARNALIDLVVSQDTEATAGVDLSALYVVDNDIAPVLSESYGACEASLGNAGNAFEKAMWQQAAAEGITVVVATGDSGSAGCDNPGVESAAKNGLAVSGNASTPYDVSVGGTDFDNPSSYFGTTNNSTTQASADSYVPEITWNDSCARSGQTTGCSTVSSSGQDLVAGGGGYSNCAVQDSSGNCSSGYSKPVWQTGTGVPADGLRDIPDVSLFAGDGFDDAFYIACAADQTSFDGTWVASCANGMANFDFLGVGGTSLATPAFAGIMALVDQKADLPQGNANFILYPLAAAAAKNNADCASSTTAVSDSSCIFYDITHGHNTSGTDITPGNNSVACAAGSPDCGAPTGYPDGILVNPAATSSPAWTTSAGYDLATGLGSVNVANLVNNWSSVSFHSSGTTLSLSPTTLTHGQSVAASISVTSSAGTPSGDVELMGNPITATNPSGTNNIGIATFTLGSGGTVTGTTDMLPGGTYSVFAHYAGDGTSGSSDSTPPITITVNPESSRTLLNFITFNTLTGAITGTSATPPSTYGGTSAFLRVDVSNGSTPPQQCSLNQVSCPTGTVTLTNNGSPLNDFDNSDSATLNSEGYVEGQSNPIQPGTYNLVANYSGDPSFEPSSATASFTISKASTTLTASAGVFPAPYGTPTQVAAEVDTTSLGAAPTGTFAFFVDGTQIGSPVPKYEGGTYNPNTTPPLYAWADAITTTAFTSIGTHTLSAQYSGDVNYLPATSPSVSVTVTKAQPGFASWGASPNPISLGQQTTLTAQLSGTTAGSPPTGTITFYDGGNAITGTVTYSSSPGSTGQASGLKASVPYTPTTAGTHNISVSYSGDSNYLSASSVGSATLTVQTPDFQMSGGGISIAIAGKSGSTPVYVSPVDGWTGTVNLTCAVTTAMPVNAQDMPTCSLNPPSVTLASSQVFSTLTVNTTAPGLLPPGPNSGPPASGGFAFDGWWVVLVMLLSSLAFALRRRRHVPLLAGAVLLAALAMSCGGGGGGGGGGGSTTPSTPGTAAGTYTLAVTGTSGSLSHQTNLTLTVQ